MKLPASLGQKKTKAIEQMLEEVAVDLNPMPTKDMVIHFNELRQDMLLLYELKMALTNCEYELQTLRHRFETLAPGRILDVDLNQSGQSLVDPSMIQADGIAD
jgi:DNA methyltransferase 1-associated protein 1